MDKLNLNIPESFFEGEERCGYYVSPEMKKVWAVELDMLNEVARICEKHHIRWFADGGTMLGAVRHGGFIPWDDDIDVRMLRPEYDRFVEVAPKELKHPYFFQTEKSDPGSLRCHAQIRNSETTGILKMELQYPRQFNQGIFIDIFPWDSINEDDELVKQQIEEMREIRDRLKFKRDFPYFYWKDKRRNFIAWTYNAIKSWWIRNHGGLPKHWDADFFKIDEIMTRYEGTNTQKVGNLSLVRFNKKWHGIREDYDDITMMPFEMLTIPVPIGYERVLTDQFGNWKEFVVGTSVHGGVIFDTDRSYKKVLQETKAEGTKHWLTRNGYSD